MMNPQMDKLVRRTTIVATVTAAYFLLTADYGSEPNVLDPEALNDAMQVQVISPIWPIASYLQAAALSGLGKESEAQSALKEGTMLEAKRITAAGHK